MLNLVELRSDKCSFSCDVYTLTNNFLNVSERKKITKSPLMNGSLDDHVQSRCDRSLSLLSRGLHGHLYGIRRFFSFLYLKKIKFSKIYVCFEIFQKYPRSPPHRATGPKCNFFLQICNEIPGKKGGRSPPQRATGGPVAPPPWATSGPSPRAR